MEELIKGVIIDTGPLLLHAFHRLRNGRYLNKVRPADIPEPDVAKVSQAVDRIFSFVRKVFTTSSVITELHTLAERRTKSVGISITEFIDVYAEVIQKIEEKHVPKDDILGYKKGWKMCFTDTSLFLASCNLKLPVLTTDLKFRNFCQKYNVPAYHLYYDVFLKFP